MSKSILKKIGAVLLAVALLWIGCVISDAVIKVLIVAGYSFGRLIAEMDWTCIRRALVSLLWLGVIFYFARIVRAVARYWEARARNEKGKP